MKKFLLFALLMASTVVSVWAVTDGVSYEPVNGISIKNVWIQDRAHTPEVWGNQPYCNTSARTAVMHDGYIYIARSNANTVIQGTDTLSQSMIYKVNASNAKAMPMRNCMDTIHQRFVLRLSIMGLQIGLMTHGKPSQPV